MARTLFYGGSFDPIHYGHLQSARSVAERVGFARVVLVPSWRSPHKLGTTGGASPDDRLAMCKLATTGDDIFDVDDLELTRGDVSYTIDTVRLLKQRGHSEVNWLIGADQLPTLPRWREPEALIAEANVYVMHRPGYAIDWPVLPIWLHGLRRNVIDIPLSDISSTAIRAKVALGESILDQVPMGVERYIREKRLYRGS
jgi:nicotinate-nucleotide adenylyltransferase